MFFNIPSTLAAGLWSKYSSAFFYQFEHLGDTRPSGQHFLKPLPLVGKKNSKGYIAHGDDLAFLFNVHDVFGNRINETELKSKRDLDTRKNFIKLILQFAYLNSTNSQLAINEQKLQSFREDSSSFIRISDKLTFDTNFRLCELSVYGTPFKARQKLSCDFLSAGIKKIPLVSKANDIILSGGGGKKKFGII